MKSLAHIFHGLCLPVFMVVSSGALLGASELNHAGYRYLNQGLVGVGRLPAATKDKYGETFGSFSAFTFQPGSWARNSDGSYTGVLLTQPDRGYNVDYTSNYTPRYNKIKVTFRSATSGASTQDQVKLELQDTVKYTETDGTPMTSYDPTPTGVGTRQGFPAMPQAFNGRLSLDAEGIVVAPDGTLWVSDEYGPYVFHFSQDGKLLSALRPSEAVIPKRAGADSFSSNTLPGADKPAPSPADPVTGRQNNQGFEGLALSPDGSTLFVLLQSAARQDGGTGSSGPRQHTRLFVYDVRNPSSPVAKAEYVLRLPTYKDGSNTKVPAQSDMVALSNNRVLVIARDGNGRGNSKVTSLYRSILVYDIGAATNILGSDYDGTAKPVAPGGVLAAGIIPLEGEVLVDINQSAELAKFGLTNGPADSENNLSEKWEALALVPALDPSAPDDWFLFVGNDNDFKTAQGYQDGAAYNAGIEVDSMVLVYRLTLPTRLPLVSSRSFTSSGDGVHIMGLFVDGCTAKRYLVRAAGPVLSKVGVSPVLPDPVLEVFSAAGIKVGSNDNWSDGADAVELKMVADKIGCLAFDKGSKDAALLLRLDPGAYSVMVRDSGNGSGVSLIEVLEY